MAVLSVKPRLVYGSLDLMAEPFNVAEALNLGASENLLSVLASRLYDGAIVASSRSGNRMISLPVFLKDSNQADLAIAEAGLVEEADRQRNTLSFDPGDGFGAVTVFDTFRGQVSLDYNDLDELNGVRRYTLTIPALPFGRSQSRSSTTAYAAPSSWTVVDAMASAAGWSTNAGPITTDSSIFVTSPSVKVLSERAAGPSTASGLDVYEHTDTFTVAYTAAAAGWLSITVRHETLSPLGYPNPLGLVGVEVLDGAGRVSSRPTPSCVGYRGAGFYRYAFPIGTESITALRFRHRMVRRTGGAVPSVWYDGLGYSDASAPSRFGFATVPVDGSVRAPGSLTLASPSSTALGDVLVLTSDSSAQPATFLPACRAAGYQSAGTNTTAAGTLNGSTVALATTYTGLAVEVPVASLAPGGYEVWLRTTNSASTTFAAQAQLVAGGTAVGAVTSTEGDTYAASASQRWVSAGIVQLPPQAMPNVSPTTVVRLQARVTAGTAAVDEIVLAPSDGAVTVASVGTGTATDAGDSSHLWIDAPSVLLPNGGWFRGASADRVNARSAGPDLASPGRHVFSPPSIRVYFAAPNVAGASLTAEHFAAYHTFAAS